MKRTRQVHRPRSAAAVAARLGALWVATADAGDALTGYFGADGRTLQARQRHDTAPSSLADAWSIVGLLQDP